MANDTVLTKTKAKYDFRMYVSVPGTLRAGEVDAICFELAWAGICSGLNREQADTQTHKKRAPAPNGAGAFCLFQSTCALRDRG